jgi:hypothetical protein
MQLANGVGFINHVAQKRAIADYLRVEYQANPDLNILCDDSTVRVLSSIPDARFLGFPECPDRVEPLIAYLKDNGIEYLILDRMEGLIPAAPLSGIDEMETKGLVQQVIRMDSKRYSLRLYRMGKCEIRNAKCEITAP